MLAVASQLSLFDEPQAHFDMLHVKSKLVTAANMRKPGTIVAWTPKKENKKWHTFTAENAASIIPLFVDEVDVYITPNQFFGWRTIANLHTLQAMFVDIDCHDVDFENAHDVLRIPALVSDRLDRIHRAGIPDPNCIVYSGRGLHLYWLIEPTHPNALPRWQACQRRLVDVCQADRQSADATRVLRLVGSVNSKVGERVRAEQIHSTIHKFDWLHDQIMPITRKELGEIRDIRALRAARGLQPVRHTTHSNVGSIYQRWYLVYQDLVLIIERQITINNKGPGLAEGMRDLLLFHLANALSWFTVSDALENEIVDCAHRFTPTLSREQAKSYCSSVIDRACKTQLEGHEYRYRYKRETLYEQLQDLIPDDLQPRLRAIIPKELALERDRIRKQEKRRSAGVMERDSYLRNRKLSAVAKHELAVVLKKSGYKQKQIAEKLGVSVRAVRNYLKYEKEETVCPLV